MKRYAVLLAPEFRLQAALRHAPAKIGEPAALLEKQGTKLRVAELNAVARAGQVQRGMSPTQATARCPELRLVPPNAGYERSAQETLLQAAETLSPFLESTAPGIITVELPPERSFTEDDFTTKWVEPLLHLGLETAVGIGERADLALLVARFARPVRMVEDSAAFLEPLPLDVLQPSPELGSVLESWGIRTVGRFLALPLDAVCERLGEEAVELWQRAKGGRARPLRLVKPREFFSEQADLEHPVEMLEPLLFLLRRLLEQIATRLGQAYLVAGRLRLILRFERNDPYEQVFTIPQPTRDIDILFRLLHTHLENFTSESPIVGLELAAKAARPHKEQFNLLEKGLRDPYRFAETLARLQALLGADRVGSPEQESSRRPDAFHLRPYGRETPMGGTDSKKILGIPCLRFRPPLPARVILNQTEPVFLYSPQHNGPINEARGPWLLEGQWWEPQSWSREEWDVATDHGLYRLIRSGEGWFLDGIYA